MTYSLMLTGCGVATSGSNVATTITTSAKPTQLTASPATLQPGAYSLTLSGLTFDSSTLVTVDGKAATVALQTNGTLLVSGYLAPWKTGSVVLTASNTSLSSALQMPIAATSVSFDSASRFTRQAAFGPNPDVVQRIQQIGFQAWMQEQAAAPANAYPPSNPMANGRRQMMQSALTGSSLLRLRMAWTLQNIMPLQANSYEFQSYVPWQKLLERDSLGNYRTLLTDMTTNALMGEFLNHAGNIAPSDPAQHPNQNFARELMQLFTIGTVMLNDDGSVQTDTLGNPIPSYGQDTIMDLSRALTGWNYGPIADSNFVGFSNLLGVNVDYSAPLAPTDSNHDHGSKLLFSTVALPAGSNIVQDRDAALDAIFQHPNLPPFIARRLIQHLVTSNPSPAYMTRISHVFEDNGKGVRGDMMAVVQAILLDPEARLGDTVSQSTGGFLQEPLLWELFLMNGLSMGVNNDNVDVMPGDQEQNLWYPTTVFGFYQPSYTIPGTALTAPEFQIYDNLLALGRSGKLSDMTNGTTDLGLTASNSAFLQHFSTASDLLDATDHLFYSGHMPITNKSLIQNYLNSAGTLSDYDLRYRLYFLTLNSDSYVISQ